MSSDIKVDDGWKGNYRPVINQGGQTTETYTINFGTKEFVRNNDIAIPISGEKDIISGSVKTEIGNGYYSVEFNRINGQIAMSDILDAGGARFWIAKVGICSF
ncbi:hypothetical protein GCM10007887_01870 [Methylobacterium haplocladii]|uniref:Uncharacterized protein n=1 Tax=Methylobacterium haplocladii TaxID=1176176 RepID=A0A512IJF0_9HYPH|nr:hypothetical protein MHA02_02240 [Methylobacterium haplocladii]GLS57532.1 hypothetical protein GCM10007887_01870 [Methylobacterium haplocladii]